LQEETRAEPEQRIIRFGIQKKSKSIAGTDSETHLALPLGRPPILGRIRTQSLALAAKGMRMRMLRKPLVDLELHVLKKISKLGKSEKKNRIVRIQKLKSNNDRNKQMLTTGTVTACLSTLGTPNSPTLLRIFAGTPFALN
jgi:hypothetical protein